MTMGMIRKKKNMQENYGDKLFLTTFPNKADVVCFKADASIIVNDAWYSDRKSNTEEESMRIITTLFFPLCIAQ